MDVRYGYCSIDRLKSRCKVFGSGNTSYADKDLLDGIHESAAKTDLVLRKGRYVCPVSSLATWLLTITELPTEGETIVIGREYTFMETAAAANDITIGASKEAALLNLCAALELDRLGSYHTDTTINNYLGGRDYSATAGTFTVYSRIYGYSGALETVAAGTAPITVAVTGTGGEEFPLLRDRNMYHTAILMLVGNAIGRDSGKGNRSLIDDYKDEVKMIDAMLDAGTKIESVSGVTVTRPARTIGIDEDVPDEA